MSRHLSDTPIIDAHLSSYFIRAPRRGEDHISQLWCDEGYWVVGSFSTHAEAIAAASLFADGLPEPGTGGNWFPRRSTMHAPHHRWVREVKGGAYQARYWLECVGYSLNLGLFTLSDANNDRSIAEWMAARASKEFRKLWCGSVTVGEAVKRLQGRGIVPARVTVPKGIARLTLPREYGETEYASERRERERREREERLYRGRSMLSLVG